MKYVVNKFNVILLDRDKEKGFNTVAHDHKTDNLMAIRPREYSVIKYISDSDGLSSENIDGLVNKVKIEVIEAEKIISDLINKGILESSD